jgi:DNA recombination protein RmuC
MAEDVLRVAGFVENVNYRRQRAVEGGRVPDFTFLLPKDLCLHMDVKFPLDNYVRSLEAASEAERARCRAEFLRDVRLRIRDLAARGYASGRGTVDCVLMFIPNEQLYGWIQEHDSGVLDEALRQKVVLCSPLTLFAVLAVIRQAVDNFVLEETSTEILALLGGFSRQWEMFSAQMDRVGARLESAQKEFESLSTTRRRMLERQLGRIDDVRARQGIAVEEADGYPLRLDA